MNFFTIKNSLFAVSGFIILIVLFKLFTFSAYEASDDSIYQESFYKNYKIFSLNIPKQLNFAGEKVPIEDFDVRERLDKELLVNTYWQSQTLLFQKRANRWFPVIEPILKKNGVPEDFKYLALIESGFTNVVSSAGATGFWQLMEATATSYGLEVNKEVDERYNVEKSTEVACQYLKEAYKKFNSWTLAAASYNVGMGGVSRQIEKQKVNDYYDLLLNEETSRYLFRILAIKEIISNPKAYGFHIRKKDLYPPIPSYIVTVDSSITDFADFAIRNKVNYKLVKLLNPWIRQGFLTNKDKKKYEIKLPHENYKNIYEGLIFAINAGDSTKYFSVAKAGSDSIAKKDSVPIVN